MSTATATFAPAPPESALAAYLAEVRALVLEEIAEIIPEGGPLGAVLYERMRDYPLRPAKGLRPALCHALCRAAGRSTAAVLRSAAVLELYHNAFLVHDDVEDQSWTRRNEPTLHASYGKAIAVNVGDGMLLLCQDALDENLRLIGLGPALRIRKVIGRMSREAVEGQAIELEWIRTNCWDLRDIDYLRMIHKKTTWYSFTAPLVMGAIIAGVPDRALFSLRCLATFLGSAFQIQDDLLNLTGDPDHTGKEPCGDLWEGKHTLVLAHLMRQVPNKFREHLIAILSKERPPQAGQAHSVETFLGQRMGQLVESGTLDRSGAERVQRWLESEAARKYRTAADVEELRSWIERCGSIEYARSVAARRVQYAAAWMRRTHRWLPPSVHRDFLDDVVDYVLQRSL